MDYCDIKTFFIQKIFPTMLPSEFVCTTWSVMAQWDTDTGTHFVQGHLTSVQNTGDIIAKKVNFLQKAVIP